jgi:hypothetical protein
MIRCVALVCFLMILGTSLGCSRVKSPASATLPPQGGVDGSGGNLPKISGESFADWLVTNHQYYVRDLIHRLEVMKRKSADDLELSSEGLGSRFLGETPGEVQRLAERLQYYSVSGSCNPPDQEFRDASVTSDGRICFSHLAFQNLEVRDLLRRILALTMHEISHLRGFNEREARRWQVAFEARLGDSTILVFDPEYSRIRKVLGKIGSKAVSAMYALLDGSQDSLLNACEFLAQGMDRAGDYHWESAAGHLVAHLDRAARENLIRPMLALSVGCRKKTAIELGDEIGSILTAIPKLEREFEEFESPLCAAELCANSRFMEGSEGLAQLALREWLVKRPLLAEGSALESLDASQVICDLYDFTERKSIHLTTEGQLAGLEGPSYLVIDQLGFMKGERSRTGVEVHLKHGGLVQWIDGDGFFPASFKLVGSLFHGAAGKASVRFATMDPLLKTPLQGGIEIPYSIKNGTTEPIKIAPVIFREYKLECRIAN